MFRQNSPADGICSGFLSSMSRFGGVDRGLDCVSACTSARFFCSLCDGVSPRVGYWSSAGVSCLELLRGVESIGVLCPSAGGCLRDFRIDFRVDFLNDFLNESLTELSYEFKSPGVSLSILATSSILAGVVGNDSILVLWFYDTRNKKSVHPPNFAPSYHFRPFFFFALFFLAF